MKSVKIKIPKNLILRISSWINEIENHFSEDFWIPD